MRRREFLGSTPLIFLGARFASARTSQQQTTPRGPDLREELSAEEIEIVKMSPMAKDVDNFFGKGYS